MAVYAIDAGGTRIKLGLVEDGRVLARAVLDARSHEGLAPQLPRIAAALRALSEAPVEGIGLAFPSLVDAATGRVTSDPGKYRDAMHLDLNAWAHDEFGLPLAVENDARMAAIGEWRYGAGRGFDDMVMVTLGTGIGTGVIQEGRVLRGKHGQSGCLGGHTIVQVDGRRCPCGAIGCAEAEASTAALPAIAAEDPEFSASPLSRAFPLDYAAVFRAADAGDPCALRLRTRSLDVWGALAVSLIHAFDPEILVFGGGILASGEAVLGPIRARVQRDAWMPLGEVRVVASERGDDAAHLACEWLVRAKNGRNDEIEIL
ncbi:MAG: ROK family protein [Fimbriimonas sp.]